jgi:hypothetical protein
MIGKFQKVKKEIQDEIERIYNGLPKPVRFRDLKRLGAPFGISARTMAFHFDENYRKARIEATLAWMKRNPERTKTIQRRAIDKYMLTEKGKLLRRRTYERIKADPVRYQKLMERNKKYIIRKKNENQTQTKSDT